jgi:methyl-accepting chemotaxis protein
MQRRQGSWPVAWLANRKVRTKISAAIAVAGIVAITVTVLAIDALSDARSGVDDLKDEGVRIAAVDSVRRAVMTVDADPANAKKDDGMADQGLAAYAAAGTLSDGRAEAIDAFTKAITGYRKIRDAEFYPLMTAGRVDEAVELSQSRMLPLLNDANKALDDLLAAVLREGSDEVAAADAEARQHTIQILVVVAIGLTLSMLLGLWVAAAIVRPLRRVAGALGRVAEGDLGVEIEVGPADEVGELAEAAKQATASMRETVRTMDVTASSLATASSELAYVSGELAAGVEEANMQANVVAAAAEQVSRNIQTVATGSDEMGSSIREIAQNASDAAKVASQAVTTAESTNQAVARLGESSTEIGNVVKVITSIAEQTNLLALNATIEAARAGEAGKGFAVVANEVKELAQETARATEDISRRVDAIQSDTTTAVQAIGQIGQIIAKINDYQLTIASAVEEQTATTNEMNRSVSEAATGSAEIAGNVTGVATATEAAAARVTEAQLASEHLARMSSEMRDLVSRFRI